MRTAKDEGNQFGIIHQREGEATIGTATAKASPISGTGRTAFRISTVLFAVFYAFVLHGVSARPPQLSPAWHEAIHRAHHTGAALFIALILVGLLAQLRVPERNIAAFWQVTVGVLGLLLANLIIGDPDNYGNNVGIIDLAFLIFLVPVVILAGLHPVRGRLFRMDTGISRALAGISLVGGVPLVIYGVEQAPVQRNSWPPLSDPHHQKWFMMAFLAFTIPLLGLVASLRMDGWRVAAWSAGVAAVVFGLVSALYPDPPSSVGRVWGVLGVLGGAVFIAATLWESGHEQARSRSAAHSLR